MNDIPAEARFGVAMQSLYDLALHIDADNDKHNMLKNEIRQLIHNLASIQHVSYEDILTATYMAFYEELNEAKEHSESKYKKESAES